MSWKLKIFWKRIISKSYLKNNKNWWTNLKEYHHFGNVTHKSGTPGCSKGRYAYDVHENGPIFKTSHAPCPTSSKISPPFWRLTLSSFKQILTPLQMITNQLKEKMDDYFMLSGISFRSAFVSVLTQ